MSPMGECPGRRRKSDTATGRQNGPEPPGGRPMRWWVHLAELAQARQEERRQKLLDGVEAWVPCEGVAGAGQRGAQLPCGLDVAPASAGARFVLWRELSTAVSVF